jgi:hypothetical protein
MKIPAQANEASTPTAGMIGGLGSESAKKMTFINHAPLD